MDKRRVTTIINKQRCTGCGACIRVCPSGTISMEGDKCEITGTESLSCGHCMAVCPESAVTVKAIAPDSLDFSTFDLDTTWLAHGKFSTPDLARLMASRRSCRNYTADEVPEDLLRDLVKLGTLAPSGTNSQAWTFTILPTRDKVLSLGEAVAGFFRKLNRMAEKSWLRTLLALVGKTELKNYHEEYHGTIQEALEEFESSDADLLFHGATAVIVIGSTPDASCPVEDALLATGNMLLAAHAMGLGTCLIGFAQKAMEKDRSITRALGIPDRESVHAVLALGYPHERYLRATGRKPAITRFT
ncbi:MAG: 4Fe-4S dicluster domain-containing protein [Desulfobacteraceae bacterium]|nr:4Fe-4S dicluster domain-containing protein [Desulfobacteraceae bacterium]